jgi:hypothetical protein
VIELPRDGSLLVLEALADDGELRAAIVACIRAQREATPPAAKSRFRYDLETARAAVTPEALEPLLTRGADVSDLRTDPGLSNCLVFHTTHLAGSVIDESVLALRRRLDEIVGARIADLLGERCAAALEVSGQFWYPPGAHMGWHTNLRKPGWRLYLTSALEPGRSFFRFRHPASGEIETSQDRSIDARMFEIHPERPFWHCVYSETDRFSFGYRLDLPEALPDPS